MDIRICETTVPGVRLIEPDVFIDQRGFFMESYSKRTFASHGLQPEFVQDNHSRSTRGVLRGLHYQGSTAPQTRLVRCTVGAIRDIVVDIRMGSPTFGKFVAEELTANNRRQLLMEPGFAHGFVVLSDVAEVQYKCTHCHVKSAERTLSWNDSDLRLPWDVDSPTVSARDQQGESWRDYVRNPAFVFEHP